MPEYLHMLLDNHTIIWLALQWKGDVFNSLSINLETDVDFLGLGD